MQKGNLQGYEKKFEMVIPKIMGESNYGAVKAITENCKENNLSNNSSISENCKENNVSNNSSIEKTARKTKWAITPL